jgi:enterochelin esterase family protein
MILKICARRLWLLPMPFASKRAIIGASFGGLIALFAAALRPDVFGLVGSQSGFIGRKHAAVMQMYAHAIPLPIVAHLIVGTYETQVGGSVLDAIETDFVRANRAFRDLLRRHSYRYAYAEYHEGHSWGLWRARLGDALTFLFKVP